MSLVLEVGWLSLTPWERWAAARRLGDGSQSGRLIVIACTVGLVVLLVLFCLESIRRGRNVQKATRRSFDEYAGESGLSVRERWLLSEVAQKAGLKQRESVFAAKSAFETAAARMIEQIEGENAEEASKQLKAELAYLGEKLGFGGVDSGSNGSAKKPRKVTTKNIPVGKKVHVVRREAASGAEIESTVARNSEVELAVTLSEPINAVFGEIWRVRYYSGSSVWEFDTTIASYNGDTLVLNHSQDVRFVNRRRFLRVSVRLRAFLARFPFMLAGDAKDGADSDGAMGRRWAPPRFVPATVTEIAGPGLRVESSLKAEAGERVLVVLNLSEQPLGASEESESRGPRVMESIGRVKYVKATESGYSIAVELMDLDDSEVDELIRATNTASLQGSERREKIALAVGNGV